MQIGLPVPRKLGAGGYKPWIEAAREDSHLFLGRKFEGNCSISVTYHKGSIVAREPTTFLMWVRMALIDAQVVSEAQLTDGIGAWPDKRQEIALDRVRVTLLEEKS